MRVTYDREADAAYLYLVDRIGAGGVARTESVDLAPDAHTLEEDVNLDLDAEGRLIGVEVLAASARLSPELLRAAQRIDRRPDETGRGESPSG